MSEILEIRWHGRGGQGAVTAAKLVAEAALGQDMYFQAFPEYGPERMGAPIQAFTRLSDEPISIHSNVESPSIVVVLDPTLLAAVDVTEGTPKNGKIIVNTSDDPKTVRKALGITGRKIYTVNATQIALETLGKPIPNTPMVGALLKASGKLSLEQVLAHLRTSFGKKFSQEIIDGNVKAVERAYSEVISE